jgi:hypothetical protein
MKRGKLLVGTDSSRGAVCAPEEEEMIRYNRKDAERAFERLCVLLGRNQATGYNDVGGWRLDYNGAYGGYQVQEIVNDAGAITCPLGDMRRNAREFCEAVALAERALEIKA